MSTDAIRSGNWWARNPFARLEIVCHEPEAHDLAPCRWCGAPAPLMDMETDGGRAAPIGHYCSLDCVAAYAGNDREEMEAQGWEEYPD